VAGQVDRLWVLDVDGQRLLIDATYSPDATTTDRDELAHAVESLEFRTPVVIGGEHGATKQETPGRRRRAGGRNVRDGTPQPTGPNSCLATHWAAFLPIQAPWTSACRKWKPVRIRPSIASRT
jgi:hypothetical protein